MFVRLLGGLAISDRMPYMFSVAEDKVQCVLFFVVASHINAICEPQMVKCWDLEVNRVVRHYHGHLSGVCVNISSTAWQP